MYKDFIFFAEHQFDDTFIQSIISLYSDLRETHAKERRHLNGDSICCNEIKLNSLLSTKKEEHIQRKLEQVDDAIFNVVHKFMTETFIQMYRLYQNNDNAPVSFLDGICSDTGYQIREIIGETKLHSDGAKPHYKGCDLMIRKGALIMTLNDSNDELIFPLQEKCVKLTKGSIVFFPCEWTHPHYSIHGGVPRFSVQTFITQRQDIFDLSCI